MEYCCVGVIFLLAGCFAALGLVFMLQYRSRDKASEPAAEPGRDGETFE